MVSGADDGAERSIDHLFAAENRRLVWTATVRPLRPAPDRRTRGSAAA
jgi:hypothetical protein